MDRLEKIIERLIHRIKISNEAAIDHVLDYWDDLDNVIVDELDISKPKFRELLSNYSENVHYSNTDGKSGIVEYNAGDNWIMIIFKDGNRYLYTSSSTTIDNINKMKELAINGSGLNRFINTIIGKNYSGRNYRGKLSLMEGLERYDHEGYKRIKIIEAYRNTKMINENIVPVEHMTEHLVSLESMAGQDGLEPTAREAYNISSKLLSTKVSNEGIIDKVKKFFTKGKDTNIYNMVNKGFLQDLEKEVAKYTDLNWVNTHGTKNDQTVTIEGANLIEQYDSVVTDFIKQCNELRTKQHSNCKTAFDNLNEVVGMIENNKLKNTEEVKKAVTILKATRQIKTERAAVPSASPSKGEVKTLKPEEVVELANKLKELFKTLGADTTYVERWKKEFTNSPAYRDWKFVGEENNKVLYNQVKDYKFTELYIKTMEHVEEMSYIGAEFHKLRPYVMAVFQLIEKSVND